MNTCERAMFECKCTACVETLCAWQRPFRLCDPVLAVPEPIVSWRGSTRSRSARRLFPEGGVEKFHLQHAKSHLT